MSVTITLPHEISARLERRARPQRLSVSELALDILSDALEALESSPTPEEVAVKIQALPPNPRGLRPATGSLAEALRHAPEAPDFELGAWNREWATVEAEIRAMTRADDIAAGRG